jgi:hypothetical protein
MMDRLFATALYAVTVEADGALFIVDLRDGTSVALNGAAAEIWRGLVVGRPPAQIAVDLAARFGIDEKRAQGDVAAFLSTLVARGFVHERALGDAGQSPRAPSARLR